MRRCPCADWANRTQMASAASCSPCVSKQEVRKAGQMWGKWKEKLDSIKIHLSLELYILSGGSRYAQRLYVQSPAMGVVCGNVFLQVLNCAIPVWYDQFKNITFKRCEISHSNDYFLNTCPTILLHSVFIPLSSDFVSYLRSDGVILPHGSVTTLYSVI